MDTEVMTDCNLQNLGGLHETRHGGERLTQTGECIQFAAPEPDLQMV